MGKHIHTSCTIDLCKRPHEAFGLCKFHYKRKRNNIPLTAPFYLKKSVEERFWKYVKKTPKCWLWIGATCTSPRSAKRGIIRISKNPPHNEFAHRVSYRIHFGEIPKGKLILHKCDNPPCVNPKHLFMGTQLDNVHDCMAKGRHRPHGVNQKPSKKFSLKYPKIP